MTVFDSSALLALARQEPGAAVVGQRLGSGHVSAANASEFIQKLNQYGDDGEKAFEKLEQLGLTLHAVERDDAYTAAAIYSITKPFGLSLGDRLCLALGKRFGAAVYTADSAWLDASEQLQLEIYSIR
jgi:PIN domain nuclease of toxin-antitoxin system